MTPTRRHAACARCRCRFSITSSSSSRCTSRWARRRVRAPRRCRCWHAFPAPARSARARWPRASGGSLTTSRTCASTTRAQRSSTTASCRLCRRPACARTTPRGRRATRPTPLAPPRPPAAAPMAPASPTATVCPRSRTRASARCSSTLTRETLPRSAAGWWSWTTRGCFPCLSNSRWCSLLTARTRSASSCRCCLCTCAPRC
mmetsp:Transcript_8763/g.26579  ORF Transcript_8763/g.26579 Transcript_8763/m.26579 type:complete len:203 (-) Transcript_8763:1191-1799(-)